MNNLSTQSFEFLKDATVATLEMYTHLGERNLLTEFVGEPKWFDSDKR